ncbi:MAG: type II toxin-antitoxin system PrlF family antitoxin [Candidatus Eremiobacteraeota bacterium]|nr:type II toxin-antitoxin system PrlF family antitoxin [Candidatus Eremiobacteraeota bacterium]MBC5827494.1 type II toxin-antitoxin system PrlF family antitoxin [Candidatus Eremiobacteraeota bacterium]
MAASTVTSKGQTTIPKAIRNRLQLKTGDRIEFIEENGKIVMIPMTVPVAKLIGILPKPRHRVSVEDMARAIRRRAGSRSTKR